MTHVSNATTSVQTFTFTYSVETNEHIVKFFSPSGSHPF